MIQAARYHLSHINTNNRLTSCPLLSKIPFRAEGESAPALRGSIRVIANNNLTWIVFCLSSPVRKPNIDAPNLVMDNDIDGRLDGEAVSPASRLANVQRPVKQGTDRKHCRGCGREGAKKRLGMRLNLLTETLTDIFSL